MVSRHKQAMLELFAALCQHYAAAACILIFQLVNDASVGRRRSGSGGGGGSAVEAAHLPLNAMTNLLP
jgi:hypothetical protein